MKKLIFLFLFLSSCASFRQKSLPEDEPFIDRKYVGDFIEYRKTSPERLGDPHLIWIRTSQDSTYGIISAYSRDCDFNFNDRLFIRRMYYMVGMSGYWVYMIESDNSYYRLSKFQYDDKVLVQTWF